MVQTQMVHGWDPISKVDMIVSHVGEMIVEFISDLEVTDDIQNFPLGYIYIYMLSRFFTPWQCSND